MSPRPEDIPGLSPLVPDFRIVIDDLDRASNEELRGRALAHFPALALWLLRDSRTIDALLANLGAWADAYAAVARAPSGLEALAKL